MVKGIRGSVDPVSPEPSDGSTEWVCKMHAQSFVVGGDCDGVFPGSPGRGATGRPPLGLEISGFCLIACELSVMFPALR